VVVADNYARSLIARSKPHCGPSNVGLSNAYFKSLGLAPSAMFASIRRVPSSEPASKRIFDPGFANDGAHRSISDLIFSRN
jgi:hypothetical protein